MRESGRVAHRWADTDTPAGGGSVTRLLATVFLLSALPGVALADAWGVSAAAAKDAGGPSETADDERQPEESEPPRKRFDGSFEIPDSGATLKLGGYVKLDFIHDFDAIGSEDTFDPATIPTDGREGENTRIHARQTRLNLDFRRPTRRGPLRAFVEVDFFGPGNSLRLRHAFGSVGPLLAGQTWSTFMDEDAIPPTLDFEEPRVFLVVRQAMIRGTWRPSDRSLFAVALEEPDAEIEPAAGVSGSEEDPLPDLTFRVRRMAKAGHVQFSGFVGQARFRADDGSKEDETIWGLALSGNLEAWNRDRLRFQGAYGDGLARYRGGLAVATDENGRLEAIPTSSLTFSYQHFWTDRVSSHLVYAWGDEDNTAGQGADAINTIEYAALNLVWELAEGTTVGAEWLYGSREDKDGASGEAHRLHVAFQFAFF